MLQYPCRLSLGVDWDQRGLSKHLQLLALDTSHVKLNCSTTGKYLKHEVDRGRVLWVHPYWAAGLDGDIESHDWGLFNLENGSKIC